MTNKIAVYLKGMTGFPLHGILGILKQPHHISVVRNTDFVMMFEFHLWELGQFNLSHCVLIWTIEGSRTCLIGILKRINEIKHVHCQAHR